MDDFDIFTNEINFSKPLFKSVLNKYVKDIPGTPNAANYQSGRKLLAEECLANGDEKRCAFYLSESVSAALRMMAVYRDEQLRANGNKLHKITSYIKPVKGIIDSNPSEPSKLFDMLTIDTDIPKILDKAATDSNLPFHKTYLKFSENNNVDNFLKIVKELPKEWTVIQLTAPYNPRENLEPFSEFRTDVDSLYLSLFRNDYMDETIGPITVQIPANVTKEGEKPLFTELYSILDENYKTIDNAQYLNNKRLVQNYWNRREDIDLRIKSAINLMEKEWLGGWASLLTGRLMDEGLRENIIQAVDRAIADWGFIRLTPKQKLFLYNLIESCPNLNSHQIKSCIRKILTEHGNTDDLRQTFEKLKKELDCKSCSIEFVFASELCLKCLSKCFEVLHHFSLVDGIKAFSQVATLVKDGEDWAGLKKARRHPVVLIVDEMLDTFPWETLPILNHHPVSRMENIHFLYYLYKVHESNIVDGYLCSSGDVGRYVINPEKNLDRMENRMRSFVQYWCARWRGHLGEPPPPEAYLNYLTEADVFLYCGHGDGCHFANGGANGAGVEGITCKGADVLSGCGSTRLARAGPRAPPLAAHQHLHIAASPMVVGMLWEVTDLEVDKVVTTLLSLYIPSAAPAPWPSVGKQLWSQGVIEPKTEQKSEFTAERDLLRAVSRARGASCFAMIASSVVARGIPVRIQE